jgi:hypothetical protein
MHPLKRKILVALTAATMTALLATGTFAWTNFNSSIVNEWSGTGYNPGGTLHDDFLEPNKDVYIENWGTRPILVRIRLDEYMEAGEGAGLKSLENDSNGRPIPNPDNLSASAVIGGSIDNKTTWLPITEAGSRFSDYWTWEMGGQKYYFPVPESQRALPGHVEQFNSSEALGPGSIRDGVAAKQTRNATVMTMAQWKALSSPIGDYWVIDADGWAYWANLLLPGEATGLLLNSVAKKADPADDYYYAINVIAQMATQDGVNEDGTDNSYKSFFEQNTGTDDAKALTDAVAAVEY